MLLLKNLNITVQEKEIVHDISLEIHPKELHVLMGPNGSGKSSLAMALAGHPHYQITGGLASFLGKDISRLSADERARLGLFTLFQKPPPIPGIPVASFIQTALQARSTKKIAPRTTRSVVASASQRFGLPGTMGDRELFVGFSGGETKRMELAILSVLGAKIAILDEPDSGLDIDGMKLIADEIVKYLQEGLGILFITHNPRMLEYILPNRVHVMIQGAFAQSGDIALARDIEHKGFAPFMPRV